MIWRHVTTLDCSVAAPPCKAMTVPPEAPLLQATGIAMAFGAFRAVDGADLDVTEGEIVGLIGPNGAGKVRSSTASPAMRRRRAEKSVSPVAT